MKFSLQYSLLLVAASASLAVAATTSAASQAPTQPAQPAARDVGTTEPQQDVLLDAATKAAIDALLKDKADIQKALDDAKAKSKAAQEEETATKKKLEEIENEIAEKSKVVKKSCCGGKKKVTEPNCDKKCSNASCKDSKCAKEHAQGSTTDNVSPDNKDANQQPSNTVTEGADHDEGHESGSCCAGHDDSGASKDTEKAVSPEGKSIGSFNKPAVALGIVSVVSALAFC